jgi:hypothetical protein
VAARLGEVLYWLGNSVAILAAVLLVAMLVAWNVEPPPGDPPYIRNPARSFTFLIIVGVGSWLVGRAARYVLAGK